MSRREPEPLVLAGIVAIAAASAAGVGSLVAAMLRRRRPAPKPAQAVPTVAALLEDPRIRSMAQAAKSALEQARERVEASDGEAVRREVAQRVGPLMEATRADLPPLTREVTQRALHAAERLRSEGAERSAELAERLRADVEPAARSLAHEAVEEAEEILAAAWERAAELSGSAREEYLPQAGARASAVAGLMAGTAAGAAQALRSRFGETVGRRRRPAPRQVRARMAQRGGAAIQRAGQGALSATTETALILFWACALGGVVYYGLLNQQQRERVRGALTGVSGRLRRLAADFRGETG